MTMVPQQYLLEKEHDYIIDVYPGSAASHTLYEDDGYTFDYMEGKVAKTVINLSEATDKGFEVVVKMREGDFEGRPDNGHDHFRNSIPKVEGLKPVRDMQVALHVDAVKEITLNGRAVAFEKAENGIVFTLPAEIHSSGDAKICVTL